MLKIEVDGLIGDFICTTPSLYLLSKYNDMVIVYPSVGLAGEFSQLINLFYYPANLKLVNNKSDLEPFDLSLRAVNYLSVVYEEFTSSETCRSLDRLHFDYVCNHFQISAPLEYPQLVLGNSFVNKNEIIVTPFSRSSSPSYPKTFSIESWYRFFAAFEFEQFVILGSDSDLRPWSLPNVRYEYGHKLSDVCSSILDCKLLITADNGINHLARVLKKTPHIVFAIGQLFKYFTCNPLADFFVINQTSDNIGELITRTQTKLHFLN